ncbi:hypothetical protein LVO79_16745 [Roseivivax marinus]|uniref:hypothetical protein n=1 Tax=Roseivivax marinus TaxID=1379903 RepID=UPI001F04651A|nr:hypothetical protein [Roseivivax marinus]UMA64627.1 hypothetical protein LVO79_16745 [Roseivivax marinus]
MWTKKNKDAEVARSTEDYPDPPPEFWIDAFTTLHIITLVVLLSLFAFLVMAFA